MPRNADEITDEWLIVEAQRGHRGAMQALASRWHRRVISHAYRRTGQPEGAAEVAQDAWVAIVRGLHSLDDPSRFRAWIYRIVDHKAVDWVRKRRHQRDLNHRLREDPSLSVNSLDTSPERDARAATSDDDPIERLRRALRQLPEEPRTLLAMFYVDGLSILEIADALSLPEGTVKSRLFHARKRLRDFFETLS